MRRALAWLLVPIVVSCGGEDPAPNHSREAAAPRATAADSTPTDAVPRDAPADPASVPLTPDGWGPVRIGMTRAQVVGALGEDANPGAVGGPEPEACDEWRPMRAPAGMIVMIERDRLTRITLVEGSAVDTPEGLGVGAAADAVEAAYGARAEVTPHKYVDAPARYVTVWRSGPETPEPRGIVYEVGADGRVSHVHAGGPSIRYVEGCL